MLTSPPVTDTGHDVIGTDSSHTSDDPLQNFLASGPRPPTFRLTALKPTQKNSHSRLNLLGFASPVLNRSGANVSSTYFCLNCNWCNFSVPPSLLENPFENTFCTASLLHQIFPLAPPAEKSYDLRGILWTGSFTNWGIYIKTKDTAVQWNSSNL